MLSYRDAGERVPLRQVVVRNEYLIHQDIEVTRNSVGAASRLREDVEKCGYSRVLRYG